MINRVFIRFGLLNSPIKLEMKKKARKEKEDMI
jgi:hypothetical protein